MPTIRIRAATIADAPEMGRVMVDSFLAAHRGQMPEAPYQKRVAEWTPEVSARAWARALGEPVEGRAARDVLLVAEEDRGGLVGLVSGGPAEDDASSQVAEVGALYLLPERQGQGIGSLLLRAAAAELTERRFRELRISVLSVNLPARAFYEARGGREIGHSTVDEEGHLLPVTVYAWPDLTALHSEEGRFSAF